MTDRRTTIRSALVRRLRAFGWFTAIYTLSIGPMYDRWFRSKYTTSHAFWAIFYEPLFLVGQYVPPVGLLIDGYLWLWGR